MVMELVSEFNCQTDTKPTAFAIQSDVTYLIRFVIGLMSVSLVRQEYIMSSLLVLGVNHTSGLNALFPPSLIHAIRSANMNIMINR